MITDSGMGGLSVCAGLEQGLTRQNAGADVELLYVNATPEQAGGYNSLPTQAERISVFDAFLSDTFSRFSPDQIAIACNTLSVIYGETEFSKHCTIKVKGIVEAGVQLSTRSLAAQTDPKLIIFATETTTEANTYPRLIKTEHASIVAQACPDLASAISRDASGGACRELLECYVDEAVEQFGQKPAGVSALLACTHYGYQAGIFKDLLEERGVITTILDPNVLLINQLLQALPPGGSASGETLKVRFISRFPIPSTEIETMEHYLQGSAPLTLAALQNQEVIPDLFEYRPAG